MLACLISAYASADVVHTLDDKPVGGQLTIEPGETSAKVTDDQGNAKTIDLMDIDEVRFGEDLVVVRGGDLLLIRNDHANSTNREKATIKLRAGLHRFVVPYWQGGGTHNLSLKVSGPGMPGEIELNGDLMRCFRNEDDVVDASPGIDEKGYRLPELALEAGDDRRRFLSRARYRYYVGDESMPFKNMSVLGQMNLKRSGTTTAIDTGLVTEPQTYLGLVFEGFFRAEKDGDYTFALSSDDGSQMYFGEVLQFQAGNLGGESAGPTPWRAEFVGGGVALGEISTLADQTLTMSLNLGDEQPADTALGLSRISAVWDTRVGKDQFNRENEPADEDTVYIRDKDNPEQIRSVSGEIVGLSDEALTFVFRGKERSITRDRVVGLVLAHAERPKGPKPGFHQMLRLRTGQLLPGKIVSIGDRVVLDLIGGGRIDVPRIAASTMRNVNGRRIDLTRVEPTAEEAIPYFGLAMPYRVNQSFTGGAIRLYDEQIYERGLAVHTKSRLHYKLERPAEAFRARFGLMDPGGRMGNVTARVIGDDKVLWEKTDITADSEAIDVLVKLTGVKRLVLEVDFGKGQNVGDRAAWCNPQIIYAEAQQPE